MERAGKYDAAFWYNLEGDKHDAIFEHVQHVEESQRHIRRRNVAHAQLYSNRNEVGFRGAYSEDHFRDGYAAITDNLIKSTIDTATSLQGTGRVKVAFLTDGADWETYKLAEDLEKVGWGLWQALEVNRLRTCKFRDAGIFGTGVLRVLVHNSRILCERVLIDDIVVDEDSLSPGAQLPRQIHQIRYVAREVLKARFDEYEDDIETATGGWRKESDWRGCGSADMVMVIESFHLPSGRGAGDGRYTLCIDTATLVDEEYTEEHYPYVFFHYDEPVTGFYGQGLAELLLGHQIRLNQLLDFERRAQDLMSNPRWWVNSASRVLETQFTNEIGIVGYYAGNIAPIPHTPQAVNPEIYQREAAIKQSALELAGISAMSAHATRPEGLEHAVALRELSDSQARRHVERTARFEDSALQLMRLILHALKKLVEEGAALEYFPEKELIDEIPWDDVDLFAPRFSLQTQTASILSETPAGRRQAVMELLQYGGFEFLGEGDPRAGMQEAHHLMGHPDLGQFEKRRRSNVEHVEWLIGRMRKGERILPEGFEDLDLAIPRVTNAMHAFEMRGAPEEILDIFRNWVVQAQQLRATAAASAAPPPPEGMGPGLPEPPPVEPPAEAAAIAA